MNLHDLETFVSVAKLGSVTHTAGRLHRSQPAITRRLKLLELQLGAPLLERIGGRFVLTEAGHAFLPHAASVLASFRDGAEAVRSLQHQENRGTLPVALVGTLAATNIITFLKRFSQKHKAVRIVLRTANSEEVSDLVRRGEVTLGLRYFADHSPELISQHVADETMVVACAPDHQWAGRSLRNAEKLRGECWMAFPVSSRRQDSFAHLVVRRLAAVGLDDAEILYIDSLTAQKRLVEAGYGLALLPASSIQEELKVGSMAVIDALALRVALPVFAVWRKRGFLSSAARMFLSTVTGRSIKPKSMLARSSCQTASRARPRQKSRSRPSSRT